MLVLECRLSDMFKGGLLESGLDLSFGGFGYTLH